MMNIRATIVCLLACFLVGCMTVGSPGQSRPQHYYLLTAKASIEEPRIEKSLGVGPVRVAPFLARPAIVLHNGSGALKLNDSQRWAEPLEQGIQRVMLQNLEALSGASIRTFPWSRATAPELALRLEILDLNRRPDGMAVLEVNWILEDIREGQLLHSRRDGFLASLSEEMDEYPALVSAYSELFVQLAHRVLEYFPD